jgi:hypothetical protein
VCVCDVSEIDGKFMTYMTVHDESPAYLNFLSINCSLIKTLKVALISRSIGQTIFTPSERRALPRQEPLASSFTDSADVLSTSFSIVP